MAKYKYPGLHSEKSRHGKRCFYYRSGKGKRTRIRGIFGTAAWKRNYEAAAGKSIKDILAREEALGSPPVPQDTLGWLVGRYQDSAAWRRFAASTRAARSAIYRRMLETDTPLGQITKQTIRAEIERRRETPFAADEYLKCMRGLFHWAIGAGLVDLDPTEGVRIIGQRSAGFRVWTEEEIARFEAYWPIGSRERLAFVILLYTGLRRGDAARLGLQHVKEGVISLRMEKTGGTVTIPLLPELAKVIEATKTSDLAFVTKSSGAALNKDAFGSWFRRACIAAGCPGRAHGLRKAGATRAANNGATVAQLEAIFGWSGGSMASHYTKSADRVRLARDAMGKLRRDGE